MNCCSRALMAMGTLVATTTTKPIMISMIVSHHLFTNKIQKLSEMPISGSDANKQKVIKCAKQIMQLL